MKTATKIITNKIQSNLIANVLTSYTNVTYKCKLAMTECNLLVYSLEQENPQVHCVWCIHLPVAMNTACMLSIHSPDDVFMAR